MIIHLTHSPLERGRGVFLIPLLRGAGVCSFTFYFVDIRLDEVIVWTMI